MNRTQRRTHLVCWAILGPALLIMVIVLATSSSAGSSASGASIEEPSR